MLFEKELKSNGKIVLKLLKNGSVKILRLKKVAKKTTAQIIIRASSPAKVKSWFKTGRGGTTEWKMLLIARIIEAKSFRAIHIIKKIKIIFTLENEIPDEIELI